MDEVRLIDADGEMLGVYSTDSARQLAEEAGLDLVEVSPNAAPPVCKILDYGKYKYEDQKRKAVAFLISDFIGPSARHALAVSNRRHDLTAITVSDPREESLPDVGFVSLMDAETGEIVELDTRQRSVRALFENRAATQREALSDELLKVGVDELQINTQRDYLVGLRKFFAMREKRFR